MSVDVYRKDLKGIHEIHEKIIEADPELKKKVELAIDILDLVRRNIRKKNVIMSPLLQVLKTVPVQENIDLETDGEFLFYHPDTIIDYYKEKKCQNLEHLYSHILIHGMLGHFNMGRAYQDQELMDGAMDVTVEKILYNLGVVSKDKNNNRILDTYMSAGFRELYYEAQKRQLLETELKQFSQSIPDHHDIWCRQKEYKKVGSVPQGDNGNEGLDQEKQQMWEKAAALVTGGGDTEAFCLQYEAGKQNGQWGSSGGGMEENVTIDKESEISYTSILSEFFHEREGFVEQEGSIDKMLYTLGFDMYDDIALVEPEELTDIRELHTIIIAIDTSGSCGGAIQSRFLRETKNVLRDITSQGGFQNIILIQSDAEIQNEERYKDVSEIPEFNTHNVCGYGGTSFLPVFERVEELRKKENLEIDCLLYLSDGEGDYPDKKTDYPTFFILTDEYEKEYVPDWIRTISLDVMNCI